MNERVKAFLEQKGVEANTAEEVNVEVSEREKYDLLIWAGLYDKVYSEEKFRTDEYPYYDCTVFKYYKKVPIEVTNGEYFAIKKAQDASKKDNFTYAPDETKNPVAGFLWFIAMALYVGGFLSGIVLANRTVDVGGYYYSRTETKFMWSVALTYWCTAAVSGTILLGFAEIIKLLEAIKNK